jgi:hypothetical protein
MTPSRLLPLRLASILIALPLLPACGTPDDDAARSSACGPADQSSGGVTVTNDPCVLEQQVDRTQRAIPIVPAGTTGLGDVASAKAPPSATLTLLATVAAPVVNGTVLQASGVALKGNHAIVSYMIAGDKRGGGLDVIKTSDENRPELISRATFTTADIVATDFDDNYVWYVGGSADPAFKTPAFVGAIKLTASKLDMSETGTVALTSQLGTSIAVSARKRIYTTSGRSGALAAFSYNNGQGTFSKLFEYPMYDARAVSWHDDRIGAVGGTRGSLDIFDENRFAPLATFTFQGADVLDARSGLDIAGKKAFIAAGSTGVQVLSIATGKLVGQVALPGAAALGLPAAEVTSNAVSVDKDLLFICNGGAGIYVAQGAKSFDSTGSEDAQVITPLGQLKLGLSANHVAFRDKVLMVATGSGGLKIVRVDTN